MKTIKYLLLIVMIGFTSSFSMTQLEIQTAQEDLLDKLAILEKNFQVLEDENAISQTCKFNLLNAFSNYTTYEMHTMGGSKTDVSMFASAALVESYIKFKKSEKNCVSDMGKNIVAEFREKFEGIKTLIDNIESVRRSKQ